MRRLVLNYVLFLLFVVAVVWFGAAPLIERVGSAPFREDYVRYYRELMRGGFAMVERDLEARPRAEWATRMESLQADFGYPIALADTAAIDLSPSDRRDLAGGELVVGAGYDRFWKRIGADATVLVMGPFPAPQVGRSVDAWIWFLVVLVVVGAAVAWTLPFARQLGRFRRTAAAFGHGDFDARITLPRHSPLAPLAGSFDRMADRIAALVRSHRDLTNAVAHELRTPLSRIRFGLEMLESDAEAVRRPEQLEGVRHDVDDLESLIEELLVYARFERTTPAIDARPVRVVDWFESVIATLASETSVALETEVDVVGGIEARFDARAMRRVLENLVHNADRHAGGRVRVTVASDSRSLSLTVDDDGPGIDPVERERVFEPFVRLDASRSRDTGGTGLGLAIVRRVVEAHGGSVVIEDGPLGGCRFQVFIPG